MSSESKSEGRKEGGEVLEVRKLEFQNDQGASLVRLDERQENGVLLVLPAWLVMIS